MTPAEPPAKPDKANLDAEITEALASERSFALFKSRALAALVCGALALSLSLALGGQSLPAWAHVAISLAGAAAGLLLGERVAFLLLGAAIGSAITYLYLKS